MLAADAGFDGAEENFTDAEATGFLAPDGNSLNGIGEAGDPVNEEERLAMDANVTGIAEGIGEPTDVREVVLRIVLLADEDLAFKAIPGAGPIFIGPAEAEGKVRRTGGEDFIEGAFQQMPSIEPIVIIAKPVNTVFAGKGGLSGASFRKAEIVIAEVGGNAGLVVARKERFGATDVGPFSKAAAPPLIVFRNGVVLREVESDEPRVDFRHKRLRLGDHVRISVRGGEFGIPV